MAQTLDTSKPCRHLLQIEHTPRTNSSSLFATPDKPFSISYPITRGKETGTWLTLLPTFVNGNELSSFEWRDAFLLRYSLSPLGLPLKCDGCGDKFSITRALKCKFGGLILLLHDEVTRELIELGTMAFKATCCSGQPINHHSPKTASYSDQGPKFKKQSAG
jgi:hypothetical protein